MNAHLIPRKVSAPCCWGPHQWSLLSVSPIDTENNIPAADRSEWTVLGHYWCAVCTMYLLISTMSKHCEITGTLCMATIELSSGVRFEFFAIDKQTHRLKPTWYLHWRFFLYWFDLVFLIWYFLKWYKWCFTVMNHKILLNPDTAAQLSLKNICLIVESSAFRRKEIWNIYTFVSSLKIRVLRLNRNVVCIFMLSLFLTSPLNLFMLLLRSLVFPVLLIRVWRGINSVFI